MTSCPCNHGAEPAGEARGDSCVGGSSQSSRRGFFHACFAMMAGIAGLVVAFPIFSFMRLPKRINTAKSIEVPLADLKEDQAVFFEREGVQIVVIYTNQEPKAFDAGCTHLGCLVSWDQNQHVFHCPCHGAIFDDQGTAVKGPVNMPLKKVKFEIAKGVLVIA
ncbi:MAG: ubiquinol-cytochrome c reductase iron-sulfur subunit [Planctomycetaceae bacterium]|nr:MAG: ubiquinol-cytochrome c reductase iron-sulfur subunit [Planctomycetaceae bacterium]